MTQIFSFFHSHMDIVFFFYGTAFFSLGLVLSVMINGGSALHISRFLWLLAGFGFVHGTLEWMELWRVLHGDSEGLAFSRPLVLLISYVFLFEFGRRLSKEIWLQNRFNNPILLYPVLMSSIGIFSYLMPENHLLAMDIGARYFFGFTGSVWVAWGLIFYYRKKVHPVLEASIEHGIAPEREVYYNQSYLRWVYYSVAVAFAFYGILGGLVVPQSDFFPANYINTNTFIAVFGIPVQVLRALSAVAISFLIASMKRMFYVDEIFQLSLSITTSRHALAEVRRLSYWNELILKSTAEAIICLDQTGRVVFLNEISENLLGWKGEEIIGKTLHDKIHYRSYAVGQNLLG